MVDAPRAPPAAPAPAPPASKGGIGSAHPVVVSAVGAEGQWAALCQARADTDGDGAIEVKVGYHGDLFGDEMKAYLVVGDGEGEAIDDFVHASPSGRYVAVLKDKTLFVIDTHKGTRTDLGALGADLRDDGSPFGHHRVAELSDDDRHVLYMKHAASGDSVVVRDLETGKEVTIPAGQGILWRASFTHGGRWVHMSVVAKDTDGDGKLSWPAPRTSLGKRKCRGPISVYGVYGRNGDAPEDRYAPVSGGVAAKALDGVVASFGAGLVRRKSDAALTFEGADGKSRELVPASCGGALVALDAASGRVLAACASRGVKPKDSGDPEERIAPVVLFDGARETALGFDTWARVGRDHPEVSPFVVVRDAKTNNPVVVDIAAAKTTKFGSDDAVLSARAGSAVVRRKDRLVIVDLASPKGPETRLAGDVDSAEPVSDDLALVRDAKGAERLVDTAHAGTVVPVTGRVLRAGRRVALVTDVKSGRRAIPSGPLHWIALPAP